MGIYYSAKIIIGLHRDELETTDDEIIENLDQCPPYYDGGDQAVIGVVVASSEDFSATEFEWDQAKVDAAKIRFKDATGQDGKLYLSSCGW